MNTLSRRVMANWIRRGPRFLPFADAATEDLPLSRLLRLSLIQVSVGMLLVLLVGTINRVMIVELGIHATIVSTMLCVPLLFAPFRALIGHKSDTHKSILGWRRVPFLFRGTMLQFGGLAVMPFALLVLSGGGNSVNWPSWLGPVAAGLAFLLVGAGLHTTQTVGLALATDQARPEQRPNVVGLMYVMLLVGSMVSALIFGWFLENFSPGRLVQVVQGAAVVTIILNGLALWKQEPLRRVTQDELDSVEPSFAESWANYMKDGQAKRRLLVIGLGTMAFGMQDVLLEPFGGEILKLSVSATTYLTATLAGGSLVGFALASRVLSRGGDAFRMAAAGAVLGLVAFIAIIWSAQIVSPLFFKTSVFLLGAGAGLFGHGTLTASMNAAPKEQAGLALGAWGAVQATAAGVGIGLGGVIRDVVAASAHRSAEGYVTVYAVEAVLLLISIILLYPMVRRPSANIATYKLAEQ
jgi:BCD family chlorophyll transporter-like MFS transporter